MLRSVRTVASAGGARSLSVTAGELANGVRVASSEFGGPLASVALFSDAGSRSETAATSGLLSVRQSAVLLEAGPKIAALGGALTGSVGRDASSLIATVMKDKAGDAAAVLAACAAAEPSAASFVAAQHAALQTLAGAGPDVYEDMHGCAFLDAPYGRPPAGTAESVAALDASMAAPAATAFGAAAVGFGDLNAFASLPEASASAVAVPAAAARFTGSDVRVAYDGAAKAEICFAYEFPTDSAAGALFPEILGAASGPTSLAEAYNAHGKLKRDLAEQSCDAECAPFYASYADTALFGLRLAVPDVRVEDAVWYATENLVRLAYEVTDVELDRAKLAFKAGLAADLARPAAAAARLGRSLVVGDGAASPAEVLAKVEAVTLDDVKKLAYDRIHDCDHALAAVGPIHELPDYNWLRTASYTHAY